MALPPLEMANIRPPPGDTPSPLALQPSGLSWPAVFLLLAAVSALTALVTHGMFSRHIALPRRPALRTISSSTEARYWRRFEAHMKASASPSSSKQGQKMVVLVTGAAGFVGSHLALALRERGTVSWVEELQQLL